MLLSGAFLVAYLIITLVVLLANNLPGSAAINPMTAGVQDQPFPWLIGAVLFVGIQLAAFLSALTLARQSNDLKKVRINAAIVTGILATGIMLNLFMMYMPILLRAAIAMAMFGSAYWGIYTGFKMNAARQK